MTTAPAPTMQLRPIFLNVTMVLLAPRKALSPISQKPHMVTLGAKNALSLTVVLCPTTLPAHIITLLPIFVPFWIALFSKTKQFSPICTLRDTKAFELTYEMGQNPLILTSS